MPHCDFTKKCAGLFILLHTYKIHRIADARVATASTYPRISIAERKKDNSHGIAKDIRQKKRNAIEKPMIYDLKGYSFLSVR
ncbi:hypothetical protein AV650_07765 [Serratia fonticola]|nr:hypothetical protein AV650_07765 [Serratia fonticola]